MTKRCFILIWLLGLCFPAAIPAYQVSVLVIEGDSYLVHQAIKNLDISGKSDVRSFTYPEIRDQQDAAVFIRNSQVIIVDVMMRELVEFVQNSVNFSKTRVYAVRGSRDDDALKKMGFRFDPEIMAYFKHLSVSNIQNMIRRAIHGTVDETVVFDPPQPRPDLGIYHPQAGALFTSTETYKTWYRTHGRYKNKAGWVGLAFFPSSLIPGQKEVMDTIISRLETEGFNVMGCFGKDIRLIEDYFRESDGNGASVDLVLSFSLKFYSALNPELRDQLGQLNVPIFNAINLYSLDIDKWRADPVGIPPLDVVWTIANPEISGCIEPTPLSGRVRTQTRDNGKVLFTHDVIPETLDFIIPRLKKWLSLKTMANQDKKVAILFYNHSQGKQNIGASYLNVFRSIQAIVDRMTREGYRAGNANQLTETQIRDLILRYARNIGSWAPGELEKMTGQDRIVRISMDQYQTWFRELPEAFQNHVLDQWGPPEDSTIMVTGGQFIIPAVVMGNVVLMPEPARGWGDDPMKLYHDPTLYPHHQYIAAYLWIQKVFGADAMVHLGTHATHEWLPGKQAGLGPSCPPEVLITDIPNIYPYVMDDVGEGIQAKRRGRGVVIDHLTPPVKQSGLYQEYVQLNELIENYSRAQALGSATTDAQFEDISKLVETLGILEDLDMKQITPESLQTVEHYLQEIRESFMPFGLHTFGKSPDHDLVTETVTAILKNNPATDDHTVRSGIRKSGPNEMDHFMAALNGSYVPSGEGNDPIRNPAALPTGKNFFGFNPEKIPSPSAWKLGKNAANQIIEKKLSQEGKYPDKVAVVLWATETIRNQGVNESTILYLMGLRPVWDAVGRVTGTEVIAGRQLNRPRIDVLISPSGLYRDMFPNLLLFLDQAVQKAMVQTDIENLIATHTERIRKRLAASGMDGQAARDLSKIRIFTEQPGSYGTGVSEMTGNSGVWESPEEVARVFENRQGFAFGMGKWGMAAKTALRENLKGVDVAVHSISSNIYGTMDNDDMFDHLGGLNLAVRVESGKAPETVLSMQRIPGKVRVETAAKTIGTELRVRYLNPKWIRGMKRENYAGAREMAKFVEYMWGWQVTTPQAIDKAKWEQTYQVYVKDKYGLDLKSFFNRQNPWAYQSITARMLEAVRKSYWHPDNTVKRNLAVEYALNLVENGVACCEHTCNNPLLNQMVVNIISLPGVMSPEMVTKFQIAVEQAMKKDLKQQVADRRELQKRLPQREAGQSDQKRHQNGKQSQKKISDAGQKVAPNMVEGFKMKEVFPKETETRMTSSGVKWYAAMLIILIIGLVMYGAVRRK